MKVSELPYRRVTREEMTDGLQRVIERVKAAQSVEEILAARAEYLSLTTEYATAQSLSYMRYTINTVDPFYLAEKDYYDEIGPEVENLTLQYTSAVLDSPFRAELEQALSPILLRSMELQRRSMSPEIIDDMVEENKLVSEYAQLMAGMLFPFRGEQLPRPMLMKYARSADRATRRACYEVLGTTLEAHSEQLDGIFDRLVHVRDRMAKKMGYENFIELGYCRMERMCYDVQAVQTFRENIVRDIVPVVSRLRLENAKRLGIDTFRLYDNEFFTPGGDPTPCGKDDLFAAAQKMYDAMGDVPGAFFRMMCENEAFDVESRPNKWGGGYCTEFPKFRQPFILANFNGTSGDVDVVTHEAGHALNAYLIADNRFALELGCGGMETAETHSMSMEFFAWPYLDAFFPKAGDAQRYRLGVNHHLIPVNKSRCPFHSYHRDGQMRVDGNYGSYTNYEPNSNGAWKDQPDFSEPPLKLSGDADHWKYPCDDADYYEQPGKLFRVMTPEQQEALFGNTARAMAGVPREIQIRHIYNCSKADPAYGKGVADALGIPMSEVKL